jgi:hypothetical protein
MANTVKVMKFTAIAFFVSSGLMLISVAFGLLPPDGHLEISNLGAGIVLGAAGAYFWRRRVRAEK